MPVVSIFYGLIIRIFHGDHPPPHFHVQYGEHNAVIEISSGKVLHGNLPTRPKRLVEEWRKLRVKELKRTWEKAARFKLLNRIKPLD